MPQVSRLARALSSPAILIVAVWCAALTAVAIGPIDYPMQPTPTVLALVAAGIALFVAAHYAGAWSFDAWFQRRRANLPAPPASTLNNVVVAASLSGLAGIGLMAFDRLVLSGVSGSYMELLRCAPALIDFIAVKRTPVLYVGYLAFSFGFASVVLFLLKGEEIKGWGAILAQLSILSPVGYAMLYSGRMPILFVIVLVAAAMLVRVRQGRSPLPGGHRLFLKTAVVLVLFVAYSSAMWSSRKNFCVQMTGLISELQQRMDARDLKQAHEPSPPPDAISASDVSKMVAASEVKKEAPVAVETGEWMATMRESWHVSPRAYVIAAVDSGKLSPETAIGLLNTYFYLTHGIRVMDTTWREREQFSPHWGVYEVGILSPIVRVFLPQDRRLANMETQLKSTGIYGFFPTVWSAAFIDFGISGAIIYILIWGFAAGWSASGATHSRLATPSMLLTFILASIFMSLVQGPLGIANSALVLLSMIVTGLAVDFPNLKAGSAHAARELEVETPS